MSAIETREARDAVADGDRCLLVGDLNDPLTLRYDPWTDLARFRGVSVRYSRDLSLNGTPCAGAVSFTRRVIRLDAYLDQASARCTLAHELVHLERGPVRLDDVQLEEALVDLVAASRLVRVDDLRRLEDDVEDDELATEFGIDPAMADAARALLAAAQQLLTMRVARQAAGTRVERPGL